jgi:predicted Rossmann fold nucleotide-binding protein DprA/Smf involved in DNA uptake
MAEEYHATLNVQTLIDSGYTIDSATRIVDKKTQKLVEDVKHILQRDHIDVIHRNDETFPSLLRELPDCPTILYVRGTLPPNDALISIV